MSVDSRRIIEALRLLSLVQAPITRDDHGLLLQVKALVDDLVLRAELGGDGCRGFGSAQ